MLGGSLAVSLGNASAQQAGAGVSSFTTRGSRAVSRALAPSSGLHRRALPFASLNLALASVTASPPAKATPAKKKKSLAEVFDYASKKALSGGIPGMVAMTLQVLSLMWLRTTINYQYRYGTTTLVALKTLYKDGGIPRFYQGLAPALIQVGPGSVAGDKGTWPALGCSSPTS